MLNLGLNLKLSPLMADALGRCRRHIVHAAVFSFFLNVLNLAPTLYMLQVYGRVVPTGGVMTLVYLTGILMASLATLSFLDSLRSRLMARAGLRIDKILAARLLSRLYSRNASRDTGGNLMREFDAFKQILSGQGVLAVFDLPWFVIFLGLCFFLHPVLGWLTLAGGGLLAVITWLNERSSNRFIVQSAEAMSRAYARQEAVAARADLVRALGMRRDIVNRQLADRHEAMESQLSAATRAGQFTTLSKFVRQFLQSVALGVGAWLAIHQQISAGAIFAASLLMSRALTPMELMISNWRGLIRGYSAFRHINSALADEEARPILTHLPAPRAIIEVDSLSLAHPAQKAYILNNVSFKLSPGEILGVAGPSGAGKSTLARLVVGCDPYEVGAIRFDGAERREWNSEFLARYVGYLPQDPGLLAGTIRDNIARFETGERAIEDIDADVVTAARAAGVHDLILQLPKGYNTVLEAFGQGLSGGQAQRVALARALYRNPPILVLDEPNAFQDNIGEAALMEAVFQVRARGGCVMVIAHRSAILEKADKVLILNQGRVQFFGATKSWIETMQRLRDGAVAASR